MRRTMRHAFQYRHFLWRSLSSPAWVCIHVRPAAADFIGSGASVVPFRLHLVVVLMFWQSSALVVAKHNESLSGSALATTVAIVDVFGFACAFSGSRAKASRYWQYLVWVGIRRRWLISQCPRFCENSCLLKAYTELLDNGLGYQVKSTMSVPTCVRHGRRTWISLGFPSGNVAGFVAATVGVDIGLSNSVDNFLKTTFWGTCVCGGPPR